MIQNKKKFRLGIQKVMVAIGLAFLGPILFLSGTIPETELSTKEILFLTTGSIIMIISFLTGLIGIKQILSSFFDKSNE